MLPNLPAKKKEVLGAKSQGVALGLVISFAVASIAFHTFLVYLK